VLSSFAILTYKVDNYYSPEHDKGVLYSDKNLAINWTLSLEDLILSEKDKAQPFLSDAVTFDK